MEKGDKTTTVRTIPQGRVIRLEYRHPCEYNNWKTIVSYCNTTYGQDDNKRYSIRKNAKNKTFTIAALAR